MGRILDTAFYFQTAGQFSFLVQGSTFNPYYILGIQRYTIFLLSVHICIEYREYFAFLSLFTLHPLIGFNSSWTGLRAPQVRRDHWNQWQSLLLFLPSHGPDPPIISSLPSPSLPSPTPKHHSTNQWRYHQ